MSPKDRARTALGRPGTAPDSSRTIPDASRTAPEASRTAPEGPGCPPGSPRRSPGKPKTLKNHWFFNVFGFSLFSARDESQSDPGRLEKAQDGSRTGPRRPRRSQDGPRGAQDGPKTAQDGSQTVSRRPKWAPRSLRDGLRGSLERAGGACTGTDLKLYLLPRLHSLCPQLELERILNSTSYFYSPVHILTLLSGISLCCEGTVAGFAEGRWISNQCMPCAVWQPSGYQG